MLSSLWYGLCNHTITVYNAYPATGTKQYKRTVIERGAFLDFNRQWKDTKRAGSAQSDFLLVIPQGADGQEFVPAAEFTGAEGTYTLARNDKVLEGIGPDVENAQEWAALIPATTPGLVVVGSVDPKKDLWSDAITHVEAGA